MATNFVMDGKQMSYAAAALLPNSGVTSGMPVVAGQIPGVALISVTDSKVTVAHEGVFNLSVEGANNAGNVAVVVGDLLFYDTAATVKINKDNTNGVRFGYALAAVGSGATATIAVKIGY